MDGLTAILDKAGGFIWGPPLLILLVGTGIFLTVRLGLIQLRLLPYALKLVFSKNQDKTVRRRYFTLPGTYDRNGSHSRGW